MTYRERREARAERLREWAAKREAKAEAEYATASARAEIIPFGQPILVDHYSAGRDRRYRERISRGYERSFEHAEKARSMSSRADGIEGQLAASIYDDDPDAVDRLREKLARLEAERKRITDYNASCRKALKADPESKYGDLSILDGRQRKNLVDLYRVCSYQVRPGGAFPSYATSNLSGQISQVRARIARLDRA